MSTPALFDCGCDPDAPMCACLPLWAQPATHENEPMPNDPQDTPTMMQSLIDAHLDHPDLAVRVERLNELRRMISRHSPFRDEPVDFVEWVPNTDVGANTYNPNVVAPPEMELLRLSILADGYTQPIVASQEDDRWVVVDGFHRNRVGKEMPDVTKRVHGYLPVVQIRTDRLDHSDRMASTIRHNRARGKHRVDAMSDIVVELKHRNWSDARIAKELGMDSDEVLRLCQISGLAELFSDEEFSRAWEVDTHDPATEDDYQAIAEVADEQ